MYSWKLVEWHFWLALAGTLVYVISMWNSGIVQGLMWRTYTDAGTLKFSFVDSMVAMHPYYIARAIGGLLFFSGAVIGAYNIWMTIRVTGHESKALDVPTESGSGEIAVPVAE
jgi:cytochrome c oxidase cbb3-type subunit 1